MDVKDEASHLSIVFIPGAGFFSIEVVKCNVGAEEVNGIMDGGGVANGGVRFENTGEGRSFEETGVEEVPLQVGERKELFGRRHREPRTGDDPSLYRTEEESKEFLLLPSGYRR